MFGVIFNSDFQFQSIAGTAEKIVYGNLAVYGLTVETAPVFRNRNFV